MCMWVWCILDEQRGCCGCVRCETPCVCVEVLWACMSSVCGQWGWRSGLPCSLLRVVTAAFVFNHCGVGVIRGSRYRVCMCVRELWFNRCSSSSWVWCVYVPIQCMLSLCVMGMSTGVRCWYVQWVSQVLLTIWGSINCFQLLGWTRASCCVVCFS